MNTYTKLKRGLYDSSSIQFIFLILLTASSSFKAFHCSCGALIFLADWQVLLSWLVHTWIQYVKPLDSEVHSKNALLSYNTENSIMIDFKINFNHFPKIVTSYKIVSNCLNETIKLQTKRNHKHNVQTFIVKN